MELRHLRYFIAVAEEGSFLTAAQRRLNTSQPSLSRQIRDLESEVGVPLQRCVNRYSGRVNAGRVLKLPRHPGEVLHARRRRTRKSACVHPVAPGPEGATASA